MRVRFLSLIPVLLTSYIAAAQTTVDQIRAQLKDKPLFLRGCWNKDDLTFDHSGQLNLPVASGPFTLAGIDVEKVAFRDGGLEIEGQRVGLEFGKDPAPRRVRLHWRHYNGKVTIRVAGQQGDDFTSALQAIFAPDLQNLVPSTDAYWRHVGERALQEETADEQADDDPTVAPAAQGTPTAQSKEGSHDKPARIGGTVTPPVLVSQPDPVYSDAARGMRYSARVEVYLWVDESGRPSHLRVVRPAGLGLDENALAAVAQYRFKPSTQGGKPVKVDLYVDVRFQVF